MSRRKSPEVYYDVDEDGTKLLIRKFDIPLPKYSAGLTDKMIDPLPERKLEKWKYQHDVPEGKIFTKRVHADVNPVPAGPKTGPILSPMVSVSTMVPASVQNIQLGNTSLRKDLIIVAPKDQTTKAMGPVLAPREHTPKVLAPLLPKTVIRENVTVNNMPENVIANAIKLVDSVNGRKVVYLKAFKDDKIVGKIVSKAVNIGPSQLAQLQCKPETLAVRSSSGIVTSVNSSSLNLSEAKRVYYGPKTLHCKDITEMRQSDSQVGTPISTLQTALAQRLNVAPLDGKVINTITVPSDIGLQKSESVSRQSFPTIVSGTIPTSNVQFSSLTPQNNREVKNIYFPESVARITQGRIGYPSVISDVVSNSGREILRVNTVPKSDNHIIIDSSQQQINFAERNISVVGLELLNSATNNKSSVSDSVLHIRDQQTPQENKLTYVPADSTTPYIINSSVKLNSNSKNSTDALKVTKPEEINKNNPETLINVNQKPSGVLSAESKSTSNENNSSVKNVVIVNPTSNTTSSRVVLPKQNLKYDELIRRRKIALKFQQDMQRHREMPRIEKTVELPAKKVKVVDGSTQTSLFCLLEPGRMVEMFLNEDSNDLIITRQTGSKVSLSDLAIMKDGTRVNGNIRDLKTTNNSSSTDPPLSKRIRLDLSNSDCDVSNDMCHNTMNENSFLTRMDFEEDLVPPHMSSMEKENLNASTNSKIVSKSYKNSEQNNKNNTNINYNSGPLASIQSTVNSTLNINERIMRGDANNQLDNRQKLYANKKILSTLFKDFRGSLVLDEDGNLPIHNAVMDKDLIQVERQCLVLIAQKKSVDEMNAMKETPLHLAVLCHDLQIVKLLLKYHAKPAKPDSEGNTAVHMAIKWGNNADILKVLLSSIDDNSPVLNVTNDEGYSPLHLCALNSKTYEAYLLVKKHIDIDLRDRKSGRTALFHAVENSNTDLSHMLVKAGASTTLANFSGQTPLTASELTFVLDRLTTGQEHPKFAKQIVAPCECQSESDKDEESCISLSGNYEDLIANASIEILVPDNDNEHLNLLNTDFHNR